MNLYNIWVSLSETMTKNIKLFHDILICWDVPVQEVKSLKKNSNCKAGNKICNKKTLYYISKDKIH